MLIETSNQTLHKDYKFKFFDNYTETHRLFFITCSDITLPENEKFWTAKVFLDGGRILLYCYLYRPLDRVVMLTLCAWGSKYCKGLGF